MIPDILVGQAAIHGIQNDGTQIAITGYGTFVLTKVSGAHTFTMNELMDETDFTTAMDAVNEGHEIEIDLTISGGTAGTRASAAALAVYPAPLAKITLSHLKTQGTFATSAVKLFDGDFVYLGGAKIDQAQGDWVKLSGVKLKKWANATQNTSLTTTVTG